MGLNTTTKTVSDVFSDIKRTFGDEASVQVTEDDILRWTNQAQREILIQNKILKAVGTTDITGGVSEYTLSGLNVVSIQSIHYKGRKLEGRTFQEAEEYILANDPSMNNQSDPILWYEWGGMINLYPVPSGDLAAGLKVYYIKEPDELLVSSVLSVPDTYYENIVQYVLAKAYEMDEDTENSNFKLGQFNERLALLSEQDNLQGMDTYPRITILEEDM